LGTVLFPWLRFGHGWKVVEMMYTGPGSIEYENGTDLSRNGQAISLDMLPILDGGDALQNRKPCLIAQV